jgi:hypothetical protein
MARRPTLVLGLGVALACAWAMSASAADHATPMMKLAGFATGSDGHTPPVEARAGGVITKCLEKRGLFAVFVVANIPAGSTYQQYWAANGKSVFLGSSKRLKSAITTPRPVHMGFRKTGLKNGRYTFQFILNGKPHVLGSFTRKC